MKTQLNVAWHTFTLGEAVVYDNKNKETYLEQIKRHLSLCLLISNVSKEGRTFGPPSKTL